ncbi:hypothetical protein DACRYDRAFT_17353 [Dacryopinax primogenitus]|uniref:Uncharacterized protein n=1 Tax=Dacryopinax primogenitus (strain DJM 731) TaxID=1858805 RepID=M5FU71_DACPD|nr:uncharacterized protein DACRYDRAFT_17353 [Dacryopinax primogenitus]EJT99723.1 hypothetical protein DACRYDRAFT_17353 [Dacryopinax primogenitus]
MPFTTQELSGRFRLPPNAWKDAFLTRGDRYPTPVFTHDEELWGDLVRDEIHKLQQEEMEMRKDAILRENERKRALAGQTSTRRALNSSFQGPFALQMPISEYHGWQGVPAPIPQNISYANEYATRQAQTYRDSRHTAPQPESYVDNLARTVTTYREQQEQLRRLEECRRRMRLDGDQYQRNTLYAPLPPRVEVAHQSARACHAPAVLAREVLTFGSESPLSLRSVHPITSYGHTFQTAEHMLLFLRLEPGQHPAGVIKDFLELPNPKVAAGRHPGSLRNDWWRDPKLRWETVREVVRAKLDQSAEARQVLVESGEWDPGDGEDSSGENLVGRALMEYRAEIGQRWRL